MKITSSFTTENNIDIDKKSSVLQTTKCQKIDEMCFMNKNVKEHSHLFRRVYTVFQSDTIFTL